MCDYCKNTTKISTRKLERTILVRNAFGDLIPRIEIISLSNEKDIVFSFCPICGKEIGEDYV